ncbi:MAG: hypothetical protein HY719_12070 [Planctomycetes bacterium]|nr:hypothetical protein [Planctomycetota bacterium]
MPATATPRTPPRHDVLPVQRLVTRTANDRASPGAPVADLDHLLELSLIKRPDGTKMTSSWSFFRLFFRPSFRATYEKKMFFP